MMPTEEMLELYDRDRRAGQEIGFRREEVGAVVRLVGISEPMGCVSYSRLDEQTADEVIEAQKTYFSSLGYCFEWKWYAHDKPEDLRRRLATRGFKAGDEETIVVLDLQQVESWIDSESDVRRSVRKVHDVAELNRLIAVDGSAWEEKGPDLLASLARELAQAPERLSIYVALEQNVAVSVGWLRVPACGFTFASLWGGSTLPTHRRRGHYSALVAVRAKEARERGARFLTVDALPTSRPILEKLGFRALTVTAPMNWPS